MIDRVSSPLWYRVGPLRPSLLGHVRVHRHEDPGGISYVTENVATGRLKRLSPVGYACVGRFNGVHSVDEIWHALQEQMGEEAPTQDEVIVLLAELHALDALATDVPLDAAAALRSRMRNERRGWLRGIRNPLAVKVPLLDPDRWLGHCMPLARMIFSIPAAVVWLAVVIAAVTMTVAHWSALTSGMADRVLSPQNLLLLAAVYPIMKALHELGHAFATKVWGGAVHEAGVLLIVLFPMPYVDATSAAAFPAPSRRILVGAAGMLVELFLAALGIMIWVATQPGLVHDLAFNVALIGGVSSLFINGNPLLRYDAYFILCDAIGFQNLGPRGQQYVAYLAKRYVLGLTSVPSPANSARERHWLLSYALTSSAYRAFITVMLAIYVAHAYPFIGTGLAVWALGALLVFPLCRIGRFLQRDPALNGTRLRAVGVVGGGVCALLIGLFFVPAPSTTIAEGVTWLPERSQVRAEQAGVVLRLLARPGTPVDEDEPLIQMQDPALDSELRIVGARLAEMRARHAAFWYGGEPMRAGIVKERMETVEREFERVNERLAGLTIRSPSRGHFLLEEPDTLVGRYVNQGELVAYVAESGGSARARVVLTQNAAARLRSDLHGVSAWLVERPADLIEAKVSQQTPGATDRLPSAALGTRGGGRSEVAASDPTGRRTTSPVFELEIDLHEPVRMIGARVFVRFEHAPMPLARQWYRDLHLLLRGEPHA